MNAVISWINAHFPYSNFFLGYLAATLLIGRHLTKRRLWGARLAAVLAFCIAVNALLRLLPGRSVLAVVCGILLLTMTALLFVCCELSLLQALFGALCAYAAEHLTNVIALLVQWAIGRWLHISEDIYLEFLSESEDEICRLNALKFVYKPNAVFDDVQNEKSFYYAPVYWAFYADPQITNGTDATHFSPEATCTRGQVVTFLWRAAGCPEPKNPKTAFTDLKPGAFYEKAVAWAVETNITKGTSDTTFSPDDTCTRGQIVTFLYRFKESPVVEKAKSPFTDLKPGAFYEDAVAWAVANKVTNGMTDTTFAPDATCTRGQVVTFLYRAVK